jgi:RNA-binding protein
VGFKSIYFQLIRSFKFKKVVHDKISAYLKGNTMKLSTKQIAHLRGLAHSLSPVVMIGNNGLTDSVIKEVELNLNAHELIKIQVAGDDRVARKAIYTEICAKTNAIAVHHIGKQLVVYRQSDTIKESAKVAIPNP